MDSSKNVQEISPSSTKEISDPRTTIPELIKKPGIENEDKLPSEPLTKWGRFLQVIKMMDIEPALLIHMTAAFLGNIMVSDLLLRKACEKNLNYTQDICDNLNKDENEDYKDEVHGLVNEINIWRQVIDNTFPIVFVLFLGAWSDIYGRKLPLVLAKLGYVLRYGGLLLCVYISQTNAEAVALTASLPVALTGGRTAISMALYSYVADTTSIADRTLRTGILTAIRTFGKSAGSALGGYMKRQDYTYTTIFAIGGALDVVALLYTIIFIKNTRKESAAKHHTTCEKTTAIFNLKNIKEAAQAFFRKREFGIRTKLYLLVVALIFTMAPLQGEEGILYNFTVYKLDWDTGDYGYYGTFRMLVAFIGGVFSVGVLSELLGLSDPMIGIVSCLSQMASSLIYGFANSSLMMYIAPLVDVLNGTMIIASRSMISKLIPRHEIGKVNSFIGTLDSCTPFIANPLYSAVYSATFEVLPGAFFFMSAALTMIPLSIFLGLGCTSTYKFRALNEAELSSSQGSISSDSIDQRSDTVIVKKEES